jgi:hypothetical protein
MPPLNHYFNNYNARYNEQRLVEDLIVESIKIMGTDSYYLPNINDSARDLIYGEDPLKTFTTAYPIEIYPNNVNEYGGEKEFFSKFGLEIRNTLTIVLSKRTFLQRVSNGTTITRPREGDLIYIPVMNGLGELYEIKFVNQNKDMTMLGRQVPYFYELELEKFKYSHEEITTGIPDIDIIQTQEAYAERYTITSANGTFAVDDVVFQGPDRTYANATATAVVASYNSVNRTLDLDQINGTISTGTILYSNTANAILVSTDEFLEAQAHANYDNKVINTEAQDYIDTSETNSLGGI